MLALQKHDTMNAYCQATYLLLAAPDADFEESSFVVTAGRPLTTEMLVQLYSSAIKTGIDIVFLEFGDDVQRGPQRIQIFAPRDGSCTVYPDCALWAHDYEQPLKLIRRDGHPGHFTAEDGDLIHVPGKASPVIGSGLDRAAYRLKHVAKDCLGNLEGSFIVRF